MFKASRSHDKYGTRSYMVKKMKNLLLQNQLTEGLETWYVARGTSYYQDYSNDEVGLTLTFLREGQIWKKC